LLLREFKELSRFQKALIAATFAVGYLCGKCKPFWKRYTSIMDMPGNMFGSDAPVLRGRAIAVSDGDTIRFLHAPMWTSPVALKSDEKASEVGLPIRICTIDTPETAKFGKSGQPFGPEAKEHLKGLLENKRVNVRLLQKDQYGRGVGQVYTGRFFFKKYMDEEMLQAGLAEVYQGGGAVYGPKGKDEYLALQDAAKKEKVGIWSQKKRESAAEYKKRTK
jgi:endonuclease YncB( thermonuclease family)